MVIYYQHQWSNSYYSPNKIRKILNFFGEFFFILDIFNYL